MHLTELGRLTETMQLVESNSNIKTHYDTSPEICESCLKSIFTESEIAFCSTLICCDAAIFKMKQSDLMEVYVRPQGN